jgi:hypothetical protein
MTKASLPRRLPEKPGQHRSEQAAHPVAVMVCRTLAQGRLLSYAFHRHAPLVQVRAEDYSVSPKISTASRRDPWPL